MQVTVEKITDVERLLTIVVPAELVDAAYNRQLNTLTQKADIKGFRPGKAPKAYIESQFGGKVRQEALEEIMQNSLYEAIIQNKLQPVSQPRVEPKTLMANQPFEFTATFEVVPEIEKVNFTMNGIEKPQVTVTDADLDKVVGQLQKQHTKWQKVDREAREHDRVVIDYYVIFDGKEDIENKAQNFPVELGSETMLPGFEAGLMGAKAGEKRSLNLNFPADFPEDDKAGKPIGFEIEIKQVYEAEAPAIDEEFAKRLGVQSGQVTELKDQIKQSLEQERDRLVKEKMKEQVFRQLLEQNPIEVPKSLIAREASQIHDEVYQHRQHDHHQHSENELAAFNDVAKKRVAIGILISAFVKQADIKLDKDRVQQRIQEIAAAYESPKEVIAWLSAEERRSGIEAQVMEDQVMDKLLESVAITEKPMSYAELKNIRI
jgi:trigger factor